MINLPMRSEIMISDTGEGITDEMKEKIFQPFFTTKSKGTGLGLAISKRLIEQHGGNIIAENNHPTGTIFRISFPLIQSWRKRRHNDNQKDFPAG